MNKEMKLKITLCTFALFAVLNTANAQDNGIALFGGATQIFPTGGLGNYFTPATAANAGMAFRLGDRLSVDFMITFAAISRLNKPLRCSETGHSRDFQKGDRFFFNELSFPIGYALIGDRDSRFTLSPFVNMGATWVGSRDRNDDEDDRFDVVNAFKVGPGLRADFLIFGTVNLRLDIGYNIPVSFNYTPARGNVFYVRTSVAFF